MALILIIETSTTICSISLSYKNILLKHINLYYNNNLNNNNFQHILHLFIIKILKLCNFEFIFLDAIAFNNGPGSYTSLKICLSTAKGISYALNIPLISFNFNFNFKKKLYNNFLIIIKDKYSQYNLLSFEKKIFFNINKYYLFKLIKKNLIKTFFLLYTRYDLYLELSSNNNNNLNNLNNLNNNNNKNLNNNNFNLHNNNNNNLNNNNNNNLNNLNNLNNYIHNILKFNKIKINYYFINTKYFINIVYSKYKKQIFFQEKLYLKYKYNYYNGYI